MVHFAVIGLFFVMFRSLLASEPMLFDVTKTTQLVIQCPTAQIKIFGQDQSRLSVTASGADVITKKESIEDKVFINCESESSKTSILIQGLSINTKVNLRSGSISIQDWKAQAHLVLEKGSVIAKKTSGSLNIYVMNGQIEIQDHEGKLKLDTFNSKLSANNITGNLDVTNFSGSSVIKNVSGELNINSRQGNTTVDSVSGGVRFSHDNGKLDMSAVSGAIEGDSDQATISLKLQNPARLKAKIKNGNYKVMVPSSSGAQVSLSFNEAQFLVPSFLKQDSYGSNKIVRGNLRGGESGRINLTGDNARVQISTF